ncbi:MAG: hypothetical protein A2W25_04430 [candidate division Zixibacteria bacterium RBG_16_53_22]|nr:MAG: hypothetical protein A2W25_04430 [candidate division Zixibacteria bacterium RBG_16_53_22]
MIDKLTSVLSRLFFAVAFILLIIAIIDRVLNVFGWYLTWTHYSAGRLFEFSAMLMIFVMVLLLRQIREKLKGPS